MIQTTCQTIEEQLTLGEELNAEQQEHFQQCDVCCVAVELPNALASALRPRDPMTGFSVRLTAHVQSRLRTRRRPWPAVAAVSALALVALILIVSTSSDSGESDMTLPAIAQPSPTSIDDIQFAEELASLANTENFTENFADWDTYEEPLTGVAILADLYGE